MSSTSRNKQFTRRHGTCARCGRDAELVGRDLCRSDYMKWWKKQPRPARKTNPVNVPAPQPTTPAEIPACLAGLIKAAS